MGIKKGQVPPSELKPQTDLNTLEYITFPNLVSTLTNFFTSTLSTMSCQPIMTSYSNASSPSTQSILAEQGSLLDLVFPGFTLVSTAVRRLLTDDFSMYARLLCACGMLVFIGKYASEYLWTWLETFFS
jgi:hypothetical protein